DVRPRDHRLALRRRRRPDVVDHHQPAGVQALEERPHELLIAHTQRQRPTLVHTFGRVHVPILERVLGQDQVVVRPHLPAHPPPPPPRPPAPPPARPRRPATASPADPTSRAPRSSPGLPACCRAPSGSDRHPPPCTPPRTSPAPANAPRPRTRNPGPACPRTP